VFFDFFTFTYPKTAFFDKNSEFTFMYQAICIRIYKKRDNFNVSLWNI